MIKVETFYPLILDSFKEGKSFTFPVKGTSMRPLFKSGDIVTIIQDAVTEYDAIVINPAAYTHTSVAIHDALEIFNGVKIEVHLSKVDEREDFRKINFVRSVCDKCFSGNFEGSYIDAIKYLKNIK